MVSTRHKRRNWSEAEARGVLAAWRSSGLSMRAYAKREGLHARRLYWWTKRLAAGDGGRRGGRKEVRFVPAVVKSNIPLVPRAPAVRLRVGANVTMEIVEPSAVSAVWAAEVMTALERLGC